jgi:DNA-binding transcriptional LysR family regulator
VVAYVESAHGLPGARWMEAHLAGTNVVVRAHSVPAALAAVLGGAGLAALPCMVGGDARLVRVSPANVGSQALTLAIHPDTARLARVRALATFIADMFERDRARWTGES